MVGRSITIQPKPPGGKSLTTHCQSSTSREHSLFTLKEDGRFVTLPLKAATVCVAFGSNQDSGSYAFQIAINKLSLPLQLNMLIFRTANAGLTELMEENKEVGLLVFER